MRRWPLIPTAIVALAVAAMVALGLWQLLDRRPKKLAYIAQVAANPARPSIAFPSVPDDALLFRRASATCGEPTAVRTEGAGSAGFRLIAECRTGIAVQLGTTRDPNANPAYRGGPVSGVIAHAPDQQSAIASLFDNTPQRMMLVAEPPLAGLRPNPRPDPSAISNPHLSYAFQWFFFAAAAAVIYVLALRRRPA